MRSGGFRTTDKSLTGCVAFVDEDNMFAKKSLPVDEKITPRNQEIFLTGCCTRATPSLRFLSEAIPACHGKVFVRRFDAGGSGEIQFDFSRSHCVEIYCVLMASEVVLDRGSHLRLTSLCQCTQELLARVADQRVVVKLILSPLTNRTDATHVSDADHTARRKPNAWES